MERNRIRVRNGPRSATCRAGRLSTRRRRGHRRKRADDRFLAIREKLSEADQAVAGAAGATTRGTDETKLPFPTQVFAGKGTCKLFGMVTNRKIAGDQVIGWHRERCGKSEQAHSVLKCDLAGGHLPSGLFGANAAWWTITILSHNLHVVMKRLVLGEAWAPKRMKAMRLLLIGLPGRVISHARPLLIRLGAGAEALRTLITARQTIRALACGPGG